MSSYKAKLPIHERPLVEIDNLVFSYKARAPILKLPRFTLNKSEHLFVKGPSGSGKSTLLGILTGILVPSQGCVHIFGENLGAMRPSERDRFRGKSIGYLAQMFNLIPFMSVVDNICLPIALHKMSFNSDLKTRVQRLMKELDIDSLAKQKVSHLSMGQQQRVAAARAFLLEPPLVVADEPTSSLDELNKNELMKCLFALADQSGSTLILASHDLSLTAPFPKILDMTAPLGQIEAQLC